MVSYISCEYQNLGILRTTAFCLLLDQSLWNPFGSSSGYFNDSEVHSVQVGEQHANSTLTLHPNEGVGTNDWHTPQPPLYHTY